jgi:hypothetical protein
MYSLQEITQKFPTQLKAIGKHMDANKSFHPSEITITPHPLVAADFGMKPSEVLKIKETLKAATLPHIIRAFLVKGLAGASYLIPEKIYDVLYTAGSTNDIVPLCSPITTCPGSSLKVDVEVDGSFVAHYVGGGGDSPAETMETTQVEITPSLFTIAPIITYEMIEDSQFDLMETHLRRAGEAIGQFSTQQFLARLITGNHGDGTQNAFTSAAAGGDLDDILEGWQLNIEDGFDSDTIIVPPLVLRTFLNDVSTSIYSDQFHTRAANDPPLSHGTFQGMNIVVVKHMNTAYQGDGALYVGAAKWHWFVLNKENATLTVRKRWMKIDNYADPIRDLVGAVISSRQESKCIYNDASCEVTSA